MDWRARAIEFAVGGAAGLFLVALSIVAQARLDGVGPADWLNFAGVIFGTMLAIFGAQFVEHLNRLNIRRSAASLLIEALRTIREPMEKISSGNMGFDDPDQQAMIAEALLEAIMNGVALLGEATGAVSINEYPAMFEMVRLRKLLVEAETVMTKERKWLDNPTKSVMAIFFSNLEEVGTRTVPQIDRVIMALGPRRSAK